jgi:hypothetical protein
MLILDQPSQAWFPRVAPGDSEDDEPGKERVPHKQEDIQRVLAIYRLLHDQANTAGFSQVIVMDHAFFNEDWFKDDLLREWRGGQKLVPPHWDPGPATSDSGPQVRP